MSGEFFRDLLCSFAASRSADATMQTKQTHDSTRRCVGMLGKMVSLLLRVVGRISCFYMLILRQFTNARNRQSQFFRGIHDSGSCRLESCLGLERGAKRRSLSNPCKNRPNRPPAGQFSCPWSAAARRSPPLSWNGDVNHQNRSTTESSLKVTVLELRDSLFQLNGGRCRATALQENVCARRRGRGKKRTWGAAFGKSQQ